MIILVCGGRDYTYAARVAEVLGRVTQHREVKGIVHGGARGADSLAGAWARSVGIHEVIIPALWDYHGRRAGPIRNAAMLAVVSPDLVVAFPGGKGTANMIQQARRHGCDVLLVGKVGETLLKGGAP